MLKRRTIKEDPLDLVPIMNLVTILIPFLLAAIKSFELSVIDTTLPAISPDGAPAKVDENPPLSLKLNINQFGINIIGANKYIYGEAGPPPATEGAAKAMIPCKSSGLCRGVKDYDWPKLRKDLTMIKKKAIEDKRDSDNVIFMPERNIRYELIIAMMDTSRNGAQLLELDIKTIDEVFKKDKNGKEIVVENQKVKVPRKLFPNVVMAGAATVPGKK